MKTVRQAWCSGNVCVLAWELICHHKIKSDGGMVYI